MLRSLLNHLAGKQRAAGLPVDIVVYAPEGSPDELYLSGACPELGNWAADGKPLERIDSGQWRGTMRLPADSPLEFKVTRGSWDTVERHADGSETGNHRVEPSDLAGGIIHHTVERW